MTEIHEHGDNCHDFNYRQRPDGSAEVIYNGEPLPDDARITVTARVWAELLAAAARNGVQFVLKNSRTRKVVEYGPDGRPAAIVESREP